MRTWSNHQPSPCAHLVGLGTPYIDRQNISIKVLLHGTVQIDHQRRPADGTENMIFIPTLETIPLDCFLTLMEDDLVTHHNNRDIAVLGTDGAIALIERLFRDVLGQDLVFDSAAMAIGLVPDLLRGFGCLGHDRWQECYGRKGGRGLTV